MRGEHRLWIILGAVALVAVIWVLGGVPESLVQRLGPATSDRPRAVRLDCDGNRLEPRQGGRGDDALYDIHDPEIGMSIVDLDLIKAVDIGRGRAPTEIKMVLTTPFCPWAGDLIQTVKTKTEEVVGPPVKVTLLADRWEPPPGLF